MNTTGWERFIEEHFPGYLLPESATHALSEEAAARFLERISGRPDQLTRLPAASTLAPRMELLRELALVQLPDLVRRLPARTETTLSANGKGAGPVRRKRPCGGALRWCSWARAWGSLRTAQRLRRGRDRPRSDVRGGAHALAMLVKSRSCRFARSGAMAPDARLPGVRSAGCTRHPRIAAPA